MKATLVLFWPDTLRHGMGGPTGEIEPKKNGRSHFLPCWVQLEIVFSIIKFFLIRLFHGSATSPRTETISWGLNDTGLILDETYLPYLGIFSLSNYETLGLLKMSKTPFRPHWLGHVNLQSGTYCFLMHCWARLNFYTVQLHSWQYP